MAIAGVRLPRGQFKTFDPGRNVQDGVAWSALEGVQWIAGAVVRACSSELHWRAAEWAARVRSVPVHALQGASELLISS